MQREQRLWEVPSFEEIAAAAEAMRHILVDSARRKRRAKHGGGQERLDVDDLEIAAGADDEKILLVNEVLEKLAMEDLPWTETPSSRAFRFFSGVSVSIWKKRNP